MNSFPEPQRVRVGGQMQSQRIGIDNLLDAIFGCVVVGDTEDEKQGINLPAITFDRIRARTLIQDFLDNRSVGKTV